MTRNLLPLLVAVPILLGACLTFGADVRPAIDRDLVIGLAHPGELTGYDEDNADALALTSAAAEVAAQ
jgi:hypothetical protein